MSSYTDPRYSAPDNSIIDIMLDHPDHGVIPMTISAQDYPDMWAEVIANGGIAPYEPPPPVVPEKISFIQLIGGLTAVGWISEAEGAAWFHQGTLPPVAQAAIASLPPEQRFLATMRATRPTEVHRRDDLVVLLAQAEGKTDAGMDQFFTMAAGL